MQKNIHNVRLPRQQDDQVYCKKISVFPECKVYAQTWVYYLVEGDPLLKLFSQFVTRK